MVVGLTPLQSKAYEFIDATLRARGTSPSFTEMQTRLGLHSTSTVARVIRELVGRGLIRVLPRQAHGIEIIERPDRHKGSCRCGECKAVIYQHGLRLVRALDAPLPESLRAYRLEGLRPHRFPSATPNRQDASLGSDAKGMARPVEGSIQGRSS